MTVAKRAKCPPSAKQSAALSPEEKRAAKLVVERLTEKIGRLIQEKPEYAKRAAVILGRWMKRN